MMKTMTVRIASGFVGNRHHDCCCWYHVPFGCSLVSHFGNRECACQQTSEHKCTSEQQLAPKRLHRNSRHLRWPDPLATIVGKTRDGNAGAATATTSATPKAESWPNQARRVHGRSMARSDCNETVIDSFDLRSQGFATRVMVLQV